MCLIDYVVWRADIDCFNGLMQVWSGISIADATEILKPCADCWAIDACGLFYLGS